MLSYEFCHTFKNTFFTEHLWTIASMIWTVLFFAMERYFHIKFIVPQYMIIYTCLSTDKTQNYINLYSILVLNVSNIM